MDNTVFIVIGYILFWLYNLGILLIGVWLEKHTSIDKTLCRKFTHIVSALGWVICCYFFACSIHWLIVNAIGTVILALLTFSRRFRVFSRDDAESNLGLFYFGFATLAVASVCYFVDPGLYLYTGITYFCLTLGDGLAPLASKLFGKRNVDLLPGKSLVGSLTVYVVSFLSTLTFSLVFDMRLSILFILSVAALTSVAEFYGVKGFDNILIEFSVFGYLVLYHYGLVGLPLQIVLTISPLLAWLAVGSKSMSAGAGASAFLMFALVGFYGEGYLPVLYLALLFSVSTAISIVRKRLLRKQSGAHTDSSPRKCKQILAVGLFSVIALILHYYSGIELFYYIFFLVLAEQFGDSMASDIGSLSKGKNINIITLKPVERGISGGVSLLGTACALIAGFVILLLPLFAGAISPLVYLVISLLSFSGTVIDLAAGALLQALYRCRHCGKLTEVDRHCGDSARLIKGFAAIDNTAVNYIAGFITALLGGLLYFV